MEDQTPGGKPSQNDGGVEQAAQVETCAVLGPRGAGKTLFNLALGHGSVPEGEDSGVRIHPLFDAETLRSVADIQYAAYGTQPTGDGVSEYEFEVRLENPRAGLGTRIDRRVRRWLNEVLTEQNVSLQVRLIDGPGAVLFPTRDQREEVYGCGPKLVALAGGAQSMILCINASDPQLEALLSNLPVFLARLTQRNGYLPFRAVLVLMTQVDRIAMQFLETLQRSPFRSSLAATYFGRHPEVTPYSLCQSLDALALARSLVGEGLLHELWKRTAPECKFGVGVASATGFDMSNGRPAYDSTHNGFLTSWKPLGIEEALYFCLNREAARDRGIGPILEFAKGDRPRLPADHISQLRVEAFV